MKKLAVVCVIFLGFTAVKADDYVYKVDLIRAAPDRLLDLIELLKKDLDNYSNYGIQQPFMMRHSQGDHWDLLVIWPIESMATYFDESNVSKREESVFLNKPYDNIIWDYISFHEELFVTGPDQETFNQMFTDYNYYHVEIFMALAGKRRELLKERIMENDYLVGIGKRPNLIFNKIAGGQWDNFSIGFYNDILDYASSPEIEAIEKEKIARDAGFEGTDYIGSYLRRFILKHHDTLAGAVRP
ncbi:MAG: hypothetical protein RJQ09_20615 [Cyclobacteriaceae bacterium]